MQNYRQVNICARQKHIKRACYLGKSKRMWYALFVSAKLRRSVYEGRGECDDYNENLRIKLSKKQQKGFGALPRKKGGA